MPSSMLKRNYVILKKIGRGRWIPFTAQYPRSRSVAIDQALEGTSLAPGEFVAVLARDWRPERRA